MTKPIPVQPEIDAAWIIALWKAVHGGDPAWQQVAIEAIGALTTTLAGHFGPTSSLSEIQARLKEIGVEFQTPKILETAARDDIQIGHTYCILFKGQNVCVTIKRTNWPPSH